MMNLRHKILMTACLLLYPFAGFAQETPRKSVVNTELPADTSLQEQAVILAAQSDAMNMTCGKETQLTIAYIKKFATTGETLEEIKALEALGISTLEGTVKALVEAQVPCKDSNFLLDRFKVMRQLRAVSYRLQGIDPSTVPSEVDFTDMEQLMPKDAQ